MPTIEETLAACRKAIRMMQEVNGGDLLPGAENEAVATAESMLSAWLDSDETPIAVARSEGFKAGESYAWDEITKAIRIASKRR